MFGFKVLGVVRRDRGIGHISLQSFPNFLISPEMTRKVRPGSPPNLLKLLRRSRGEPGVAMRCPNRRRTTISALTREPLSSAKHYAGNHGEFQVEPPTRPASL